MKTGALIFAQNNSSIDYVKMAAFAAERLQHYLNIPVSIATNSKSWLLESHPNHVFDKVIEIADSSTDNYRRFNDGSLASKIMDWKNGDRSSVYDLSPYDTTLVIDSDYIINSDFLLPLLRKDDDLQLFKTSCDISGWRSTEEYNKINPYSIEFYWATVFIFKKNKLTDSFFKLVTYIKQNWNYFVTLYNITSPVYRNDFAFSIAIHIMNGNMPGEFATQIPGNISFTTDRDILISIKDDAMQFLIEKKDYLGEYTAAKTNGIDVHVMNKASLNRFIDGGSGV
jgi:hypothetical protein